MESADAAGCWSSPAPASPAAAAKKVFVEQFLVAAVVAVFPLKKIRRKGPYSTVERGWRQAKFDRKVTPWDKFSLFQTLPKNRFTTLFIQLGQKGNQFSMVVAIFLRTTISKT